MIVECPECHTKFMVPDSAIGNGRDVRCGKCTHVWFLAPDTSESSTAETKSDKTSGKDTAEQGKEKNKENTENTIESAVEDTKDDDDESSSVEATDKNADDTGDDNTNPEETSGPDDDIPMFSGEIEAEPIAEGSGLPVPLEKRGATPALIAACFALLLANTLLGLITFRDTLQPYMSWVYSPLGIYPTDGVVLADFKFEQRALGKKKRITLDCTIVNKSDEVRRVPALQARLMTVTDDVLGKESNLLEEGKLMQPGGSYPCGKIRMTNPFSSAAKLVLDLGNPFEIGLRD